MKLAPLLLAAPMVLTMAAADPRPRLERRVLDRWQFARQDTGTAGGGASNTGGGSSPTSSAAAAPTSSAAAETTSTRETPTSSTTPVQPSTTSTTTREAVSTPSTSTTPVQSATTPTSNAVASQTTPPASATTPTTTAFSLSTPPPTTQVISTTDHNGQMITSIVVITQSALSVPATASSTSTPAKTGVSQSTVIGLAVTGSIAGLLIILLIVWKLTNKRFSDLDENDDDAIKWPELNNKDSAAMTPIPARPSTRAAGGAETDTLGASEFDRQSAVNSTADLSYPPYSDDPGYGARPQYYDPYGGAPGATKPYPSPPGSHDGDHKNWGGAAEAQYYDAPRAMSPGPNTIARGMSPGPGMAYDARVASPAPNMGYDNRMASPAPPSMAYADPVGRTGSPGPAGGYGYAGGYAQADPYGGRHSPGPNMAYGQPEMDPYGRRSPGPGMAYGGSVGRVGSPGPNAAYR